MRRRRQLQTIAAVRDEKVYKNSAVQQTVFYRGTLDFCDVSDSTLLTWQKLPKKIALKRTGSVNGGWKQKVGAMWLSLRFFFP